jgi:hypothetical protein
MTKHFISYLKKIYFFFQNCNAGILCPIIAQASMKEFQATGETFNPQKRTSGISKHEIYSLVSSFLHFCLLGFGSSRQKSMRIHAHPDPQQRNTDQQNPKNGGFAFERWCLC